MGSFFKTKRLLVDTNVWMAYFLGSESLQEETKFFLSLCDRGRGFEILYTPATLKDLFYLIPRVLRRLMAESAEEETSEVSRTAVAWSCARKVMDLATAAPLSVPECEVAWMLRKSHGDLEDNLLIASAETCDVDYVVTYDKELIRHFAPVCATPAQVISLLRALGG